MRRSRVAWWCGGERRFGVTNHSTEADVLNVGSLFTGIGGIDLGLERAGMQVVWQCEADEWRRGLLRERFPGIPVYHDVRDVGRERQAGAPPVTAGEPDDWRREAGAGIPVRPDLICGGFPCQDLSVAGRRKGLAGDRSGLFFEFARIAESLRPRFVLIENVPGLLSSDGGRDFGVVLGTLADIGYGLGWRILDSRFFGVPQRRRRVFIVGIIADGDPRAAAECAGEVLAVGSRCPGHPAAGTQAREDLAPTLGASVGGGRGWDANPDRTALIAPPLTASIAGGDPPDQVAYVHSGGETYNEADAIGSLTQQSANETSAMAPLVATPLSHGSNPNSNAAGRRREDDENLVTAFSWQQGDDSKWTGTGRGRSWVHRAGDYAAGLSASGRHDAIQKGASVRRLTPRECERLQGFPDNWTALGPDSRRYAALGDAVTVNVAEWIGRRILRVAA